MKPLVIYHGGCSDGFTAAWIVANSYAGVPIDADAPYGPEPEEAVELHAGVYNTEPPFDLIDGRDVVIVDFSYAHAQMEKIIVRCKSLVWLDHHKTAIDDAGNLLDHPSGKVRGSLNTDRCGAWLAWEWFFPNGDVPTLVRLVDDRDRWVFADARTKAFHAAMSGRSKAFAAWDAMARDIDGELILTDHEHKVAEMVELTTVWEEMAGQLVPSANVPHYAASDAADLLLKKYPAAPFACCWFMRRDRRVVYSLRSRKGSDVDVGEIARQMGGGGHKHAAGFAA